MCLEIRCAYVTTNTKGIQPQHHGIIRFYSPSTIYAILTISVQPLRCTLEYNTKCDDTEEDVIRVISHTDVLVSAVTQFGAAAKLPGSGGAVLGLSVDQQRMVKLTEPAHSLQQGRDLHSLIL